MTGKRRKSNIHGAGGMMGKRILQHCFQQHLPEQYVFLSLLAIAVAIVLPVAKAHSQGLGNYETMEID